MSKRKKIIITSLLLAMQIILSRFLSLKTPLFKLSFAFVPTMLCATWLGLKYVVILNILGDLIGATLFPTGPFFIGYTISTAIAAIIYGLLLYKPEDKEVSTKTFVIKTIISVVLVGIIINIGLNTLWTSITSGKAFITLLGSRVVKNLITIPIHIAIFLIIEKYLTPLYKKEIASNNDISQ
jgi:ECF transporter S component (folate family)